MKRLAGAHVWANWSNYPLPGHYETFSYFGSEMLNGTEVHHFKPYKRTGMDVYLTLEFILRPRSPFKPFLIDMEALTIAN